MSAAPGVTGMTWGKGKSQSVAGAGRCSEFMGIGMGFVKVRAGTQAGHGAGEHTKLAYAVKAYCRNRYAYEQQFVGQRFAFP